MSEKVSGRVCPIVLGLTLGLLWGLALFFLSLVGAFLFPSYGAAFITTLESVYIGYKATLVGGLIGFAWGFVDFFVFGFLIAFIYNCFMGCKCRHANE